MGKCYDIYEILITVKGGMIQNVDIPKGANVRVKVRDFDCDETPETDDRVSYDENGDEMYESVWEREE